MAYTLSIIIFIAFFYALLILACLWIFYQISKISKRYTKPSFEYFKSIISGGFGGLLLAILFEFNNKVKGIEPTNIYDNVAYLFSNGIVYLVIITLFVGVGLIIYLLMSWIEDKINNGKKKIIT